MARCEYTVEITDEMACPCEKECAACLTAEESEWPCGGNSITTKVTVTADAEPRHPGNRRGHPDTWEEDSGGWVDILRVEDENGKAMTREWIKEHHDELIEGFDEFERDCREEYELRRAEARLDDMDL